MSAPTYSQVHYQLRKQRGRAADHLCQCGQPAQEWAWNRTGELLRDVHSASRVTYGADLDTYEPLCRKCHRNRDAHGGAGWLTTVGAE